MEVICFVPSLVIDDGSTINSLQGLEEALFLHSVIINGSHPELDISALKEARALTLLVIDPNRLNDEGKNVVHELELQGVHIVKINDDPVVPTAPSPIQVYIDGEPMDFAIDPVIKNGSTLVQFRPLFEMFGLEVGWDQATQKVTGTKEKLKIELTINSKTATVAGRETALAAAPILVSGNTMVPLRFIGEATGRKVIWDAESRSVYINQTITSYNFDYLYSNHTIYAGDQVNGAPHGKGTLQYRGQLLYNGSFKNGVIEGTGIMYDLEDRKSYYEGDFKNNRFHGAGKNVYSDGSYHIGSYIDGMREGNGKMFYADGSLAYIGAFHEDALHGEGTYYFNARTYYIGSISFGLLHGKGKIYNEGNLTFEGEFVNGSRYYGKNFANGKLNFEGFFVNNVPHGYGTVYSSDGNKYYRGQVKGNFITGIGIYYLDDGSRYIGEVYNNTMDGLGFIKHKDDLTITNLGYWAEDEYIGAEEPAATDHSRIKQLTRNAIYNYVDGMYINDYNLDRSEAIMFVELGSKEDLDLYHSLSKEAKAQFVNSFAQDRWGDVLGVDNCYVYVMFDGKVYAEATISYEMADGAVQLKEYPKGNGKIHE